MNKCKHKNEIDKCNLCEAELLNTFSLPGDKIVINCNTTNCKHIYGYWQDGEDCIIYSNENDNLEHFDKEECCVFNYCPICGCNL